MNNENYYEEVEVEEFYWQEEPTDEEMEELFIEAINEEFQLTFREIREEYEAELAIAA